MRILLRLTLIKNVEFGLPVNAKVLLEVYNILGEKVTTLINSGMNADYHQVEFNANQLASGVYIYRLTAVDPSTGSGKSFKDVKKFILMK